MLKTTDYYIIVLVGIGLLSGLPGDHHRRPMNNRVHWLLSYFLPSYLILYARIFLLLFYYYLFVISLSKSFDTYQFAIAIHPPLILVSFFIYLSLSRSNMISLKSSHDHACFDILRLPFFCPSSSIFSRLHQFFSWHHI